MNIRKTIKLLLMWQGALLKPSHKSKILYYHDVYLERSYKSLDSDILMGTSLDMFKKHIEIIRREGYTIVPHITKGEGEVSILLDDGFRGIWDTRQFFYDNDIKPTVLLAVDLIGKDGFLKPSEIKELQAHGFIFQCHSWSHSRLDNKNEMELVRELKDSKVFLEELLETPVDDICLPLGYYSDLLLRELEKYGYKEIYSSVSGDYDDMVLGRMRTRNLCQFSTPLEVKLILKGGSNAIRWKDEKMFYTKS